MIRLQWRQGDEGVTAASTGVPEDEPLWGGVLLCMARVAAASVVAASAVAAQINQTFTVQDEAPLPGQPEEQSYLPAPASVPGIPAFWLYDDGGYVAPSAVLVDDDAGYQAPVPWVQPIPVLPFDEDGDVVTAYLLWDDDPGYRPPIAAIGQPPAPFLDTDKWPTSAAASVVDDDPGVQLAPRSPWLAPPPVFTDTDKWPTTSLTVVDDDPGYRSVVPPSASLPPAVFLDTDKWPTTFTPDEDYWQPAPPQPCLWTPPQAWEEQDRVPLPPPVVWEDDSWTSPNGYQAWPLLRSSGWFFEPGDFCGIPALYTLFTMRALDVSLPSYALADAGLPMFTLADLSAPAWLFTDLSAAAETLLDTSAPGYTLTDGSLP